MTTTNRAMPGCPIIPELGYPDVAAAVDWLCDAFGFTLRLRFGGHRAQLNVGSGGAMVVTERDPSAPSLADHDHSVMVRVDDVDLHCTRAQARGARILQAPADFPYGERQYTALDLGGHRWTFSQTIADFDPRALGAIVGELNA